MSYHSMINVHIADGFADDCEELIHRCTKKEPLTYHTFCSIYKAMNFDTVYKGRISGAEIAELSEELVHIAKRYMVANTSNFEESVAGLFLVYALVNLQPYNGFAALRLTPEDVPALTRMEVVARRERRLDVMYILGCVLIRGPCQYHAAQREYGMEPSLRKYLEGFTGIDKMGARPKGVFYRQNEELDIIRELMVLNRKYTEAKTALTTESGERDRNLNYSDQHLEVELDLSLKKIINGLIEDTTHEDEEIINKGSAQAPSEPAPSDHHTNVQDIKRRAMSYAVAPMRHLTTVENRASPTTSKAKPKSPVKATVGKIKTGSPTKPLTTGSPLKRKSSKKSPLKKNAKKKRKLIMMSDSDSDDNIETISLHDDSSGEDLDLESFDKVIEETQAEEEKCEIQEECKLQEVFKLPDEYKPIEDQDVRIEIDTLPIIIHSQDDNQYIEIEIIDEMADNNLVSEANETKDMEEQLATSEVAVRRTSARVQASILREAAKVDAGKEFKTPQSVTLSHKPEKRDHKKPLLKSKFRRMGMLPIANFEDVSTSRVSGRRVKR